MPAVAPILDQLRPIDHLTLVESAPLSEYTRFGIGGPASLLVDTEDCDAFVKALQVVQASGEPFVVIGGGTNLIVADEGYRGIVLRYLGERIERQCDRVHAEAGAVLQDLVDFCNAQGLQGVETMTGIPGSVGAAVYGNAGAYGHSISERVLEVKFYDGDTVRSLDREGCAFHYRQSVFKQRKEWIIFSTTLSMQEAEPAELQKISDSILQTRNKKYPPAMKCAGSIFKNFLWAELPEAVQQEVPQKVIIEGKVPAAYFLEAVGAKGMRNGDIHVADYHANLIYNAGEGTARQLREVIAELKTRVTQRFGIDIEEEVQYVGFS